MIDKNGNIVKTKTLSSEKEKLEILKENIGVTFVTVAFLVFGPSCLFLFLVLPFYSQVWWPTVLYMSWWLWDLPICNSGGRPGHVTSWARSWRVWTYFVKYFPINLVKTVDLSPEKNYMFCSHPHGVLCYGVIGALGSEGSGFSKLFPGLTAKLITLEGSFWLPGFRELLLGMGACSSSKKSLQYLLSRDQGMAPVLMVGGLPEISNYNKDKIVLIIKKRKGFIKLAIENGADLVPVFSFGETDIFEQPSGVNSLIDRFFKDCLGFHPIVFSGRGYLQNWFGVLPNKKQINVVVGSPIPVQKKEDPSLQDIDQLQLRYIEGVLDLYNGNKSNYGYQNIDLEIR